jgi:hypothetical protein
VSVRGRGRKRNRGSPEEEGMREGAAGKKGEGRESYV